MNFKFRNPNPDFFIRDCSSPGISVSISFPEDSSVTKQEFKNECDINTMMGKYLATGQVPIINQRTPQYLDVSTVPSFADAMAIVHEASELFNALPSTLRVRFGHDPQAFLDYCSDKSNLDEMRSLGLVKDLPTVESVKPAEVQNLASQNTNSV